MAETGRGPASPTHEWRLAGLVGATVGLCLAPAVPGAPSLGALAASPLALAALVALRPRADRLAGWSWLLLVGLACALGGLLAGAARLEAIDSGALRAAPGTPATVAGTVASAPRRYGGDVSVRLGTPAGRLLITAPEPVPDLSVGGDISARGPLSEPEPWQLADLRRHGIAMVLHAEEIEPLPGGRGGLAGRVDSIRRRAEDALDRGMPDDEAALARGFVLGQDDRIDPRTRDDFKRSGLAHLLAVSGQNVILLALLAWPLLALLGLTVRARLLLTLALIALYVPVTGAGPSIQRAGVMGAAAIIAALADRPRSRWYAVLLATATTLALNPLASADIGWQLSFAAVIGIFLWTSRLASVLAPGGERGWRRSLAEGAGMTGAATVATAPLMAHHFEAVSIASLPANLLALPAEAPAMWLGMLSGIAGQVPVLPVEPLNWLNSLCLAYIAQIARWLASPDWALLDVSLATPLAVAAAYLVLLAAMEGLLAFLRRRAGLGPGRGTGHRPRRAPKSLASEASRPPRTWVRDPALAAFAVAAALAASLVLLRGPHDQAPESGDRLVVRVLDVGQGDSILLDPPAGDPVLVDTGPPGSGVADRLNELGIGSLAAVTLTHDASDHAGGLGEVLDSVDVGRVVTGPDGPIRMTAEGTAPVRLVEGEEIDSGELHLTALWPPTELSPAAVDDPNRVSLVLLAEWRHFSMLLTGDAEAEMAPVALEPVDVLKVAHHGSEDAGLGSFLERAVPKLAVISVGENSYGHPTPETLAELREHEIPTIRTDESGEVEIEADATGWRVGE